jgi:NADH dehydrogenase
MDALRFYPRLTPAMVRFVLLEAAPTILRDLGEGFARRVQDRLIAKGIEVRAGATLKEVRDDRVLLASGEPIPTETVVWTAGVAAHPLAAQLGGSCDERGRVKTSPAMEVLGVSGVWALGDSAAVPDAKAGGAAAPQTAQHVLRQARTLVRNVASALDGRPLAAFGHGNLGMLAGLGKHDGAGRLLGLPVSGPLAWWLVRTYHLLQLPTLARKVRVLIDWNIALLFPRDIAQLGSLGSLERRQAAGADGSGAQAAGSRR